MRKTLITLVSLLLIAVFSLQTVPVQAADPTELNLTIEDLMGKYNGEMEYLFEKSTGHFAALTSLPERVNDIEFILSNKYNFDPESDFRFSLGSHGVGSVYLEEDGSFYGLDTSSSSRSLELLGHFEIEGTRILFQGIIKEKVWDMPGAGPDEGTQEISITGSKEGPASLSASATEEPIELGEGVEKGRISFVQGNAFIQRGNRIIPAVVGEGLLAGDTVSCEQGSEVTIAGAVSGSLKIVDNVRFQIPEDKPAKKATYSSISVFMGEIWTKTKEFLTGESFEVKTPDGACGVRG